MLNNNCEFFHFKAFEFLVLCTKQNVVQFFFLFAVIVLVFFVPVEVVERLRFHCVTM